MTETTGLTNSSGSVTDSYTYDAFGATKTHTGTSVNVWKFTGEQNDVTVNQSPYYLRARYYDPVIGRFFTRDPFLGSTLDPQSVDRYPYVLDDPADSIDPYGLFCFKGHCTSTITNNLGKAASAAKSAVQWVGEDYHWVTVAEIGGTAAVVMGTEIVTAGAATPLLAGVGGAMIAGGLGLGGVAAAYDISLRAKACREGDALGCAEAGIDVGTVPFGYLPGCTNFAIGESGLLVGTAGDIAKASMASGHSNVQEPAACKPPKE